MSAIDVVDNPDPGDVAVLLAGLAAHNDARAELANPRSVGAFARADGRIVGGVDALVQWSWLFVKYLWVTESARGTGLGTQILTTIEDAGRARGARAVHLDTFSFQAKPFYLSLGYTQFGELNDFPRGHQRHFLWKRL